MKGFVNLTHTNNKKIADLKSELETKQTNKPDGQNELVNNTTKKINNVYLPDEVIDLDIKLEGKQDKKPDGQTDLINAQTGKLDNAYLPDIISGTSRKFAGTFGEDGVIVASAYASELNGQGILGIDLNKCVGYEFAYTGENPFLLGDLEVNKNDLIVCNGEQEPNWTLYDNSDKVVSVNGQTGAVQLDFVPKSTGGRDIYGTDWQGNQTTYKIDYPNAATVNAIPLRALNGAIQIDDASCEDGGSGSIVDGQQAVNKNFVLKKIAESGGIKQLVGTEDKPINFATDMEVGHLYSISGYVYVKSNKNQHINSGNLSSVLVFKPNDNSVYIYGVSMSYSSGVLSISADHHVMSEYYYQPTDGALQSSNIIKRYSTIEKINGTIASKTTNFYVPTTSGAQGQILQSNGNTAPTWITPNFATLDDVNNAINGMWEESY